MDNTENNNQDETTNTEVTTERTQEPLSFGRALKQNFKAEDEQAAAGKMDAPEGADEASSKGTSLEATATPAAEVVQLVPPADMNKAEKDAFLNPSTANAHVLQQYLNRRAYETRSDYQRRVQEVEDLKKQTSGVFDAIKQYEDDYAKQGITISDVARRSIAWDRAMQKDPYATAVEWLNAYGLSVNDLIQQPEQYGYNQQPVDYLTREDAERIADEKLQAAHQAQEQKAVAYYNERVVESFIKSKPLFKDPETASQLEAEMAPIVAALSQTGKYSGPEQVLETAYNYVIAGNATFSNLNNAMVARAVVDQKQAVAQKAKAASRSISGSAGSGTPSVQTKDIRDNLRRRMTGD
jgi:hypothetical protein